MKLDDALFWLLSVLFAGLKLFHKLWWSHLQGRGLCGSREYEQWRKKKIHIYIFFFWLVVFVVAVFLLARSVTLCTWLVFNLVMHLTDSAVVKYYVETTDWAKLSDWLYWISQCPCSYFAAFPWWWKEDVFFFPCCQWVLQFLRFCITDRQLGCSASLRKKPV